MTRSARTSASRIESDMPETLPTISPLAAFVLMLMIFSIIGAWIAMILRFAFGLPVLPPNTPRLVPWAAGTVLLSIVVYVGIQFVLVNAFAAVSRPRPVDAGGPRASFTPGEMMTLSAIQNAAVLLLIPLTLALTSGARPKDLGVVSEGLDKQVIRGVVAYPLLAPVVFGVMALAVFYLGRTNHPLQDAIMKDQSPGMIAILILAGAFLAPAAEELLFRGVLLGWLTRLAIGRSIPVERKPEPSIALDEGYGPSLGDANLDLIALEVDAVEGDPAPVEQDPHNFYAPPASRITAIFETVAVDPSTRFFPLFLANIAVSLIFASLHGTVWPTPIPIFFLSLGLGLLYQRTGSIIPPTVLHMTFNGVSTLLMFLTVGTATPKEPPKVAEPPPVPARVASMLGSSAISGRAH